MAVKRHLRGRLLLVALDTRGRTLGRSNVSRRHWVQLGTDAARQLGPREPQLVGLRGDRWHVQQCVGVMGAAGG